MRGQSVELLFCELKIVGRCQRGPTKQKISWVSLTDGSPSSRGPTAASDSRPRNASHRRTLARRPGDIGKLDDLDRLYPIVREELGSSTSCSPTPHGAFSALQDITEDHDDSNFETNVKVTLFTAKKALPLLYDGASIGSHENRVRKTLTVGASLQPEGTCRLPAGGTPDLLEWWK